MRKIIFLIISFILISSNEVLARAGGGGSGGGDGGGGGGFSSSHSGGGGSSGGSWFGFLFFIIFITAFTIIFIYAAKQRKIKIKNVKKIINSASAKDIAWEESSLKKRVSDVFYAFQKSWSELDPKPLNEFLTQGYLKRIILELNVLQNEKRKNLVNSPKLLSINILNAKDSDNNEMDSFIAEIVAQSNDVLMDTELNSKLYEDNSTFTEYWEFGREGGIWKLNIIRQETEEATMIEPKIVDFSKENNFFYDPDFGWLMMPNKGVLFNKTNFKVSDINNHVIGYFRDKIVEFYTFVPYPNSKGARNYVIAQAILPMKYNDIFIRRKKLISLPIQKLRKISLESTDFNKRFELWADPKDSVSSLELLSPNFMEKIYGLPFELNIEIVGSFLYFYTEDRRASYNQMLEIISWAFDEMKM